MQEQEGWQFPDGSSWHPYHSSFHIPDSPCSDPHFSDTSPYSTHVSQVNLHIVGVEYDSPAFLEPGLSFDSDYALTSLDPTQDGLAWTSSGPEYGSGLVPTEDPAMNDVLQTSDEVYGYSSSTFAPLPTSYATNPDPHTSSLGQDMEMNFQATNPYATSMDIPPPYWGSGQQETPLLVESPSTLDLADPAAGLYSPSYPGESSREVDYNTPAYTASPSCEQPSIPSETPIYLCEWQDGNGAVCGEVITRATLPGHLSEHGIKNKPRDDPTKCNWVGCRKKKPINRESIVRHIRETHLRLKRSS